jgi:hypothetical protein
VPVSTEVIATAEYVSAREPFIWKGAFDIIAQPGGSFSYENTKFSGLTETQRVSQNFLFPIFTERDKWAAAILEKLTMKERGF